MTPSKTRFFPDTLPASSSIPRYSSVLPHIDVLSRAESLMGKKASLHQQMGRAPALKRLGLDCRYIAMHSRAHARGLRAICQKTRRIQTRRAQHSHSGRMWNGMVSLLTLAMLLWKYSSVILGPLCPRYEGKLLQGRSHLETIRNNFNYFFYPHRIDSNSWLPLALCHSVGWMSQVNELQFLLRFYEDLTSDLHGKA